MSHPSPGHGPLLVAGVPAVGPGVSELGLLVGGQVVPGTELVRRSPRAWWGWDDPRDRADLRRRPARRDTTLLVGHWTAGPIRDGEEAAVATCAAMKSRHRADGTPMSVSIHFVVGWDGQVWQTADLGVATIHASSVSPYSVGVECAWPGTAEQADAIRASLERRGRPVHPGYLSPPDTRMVRGRRLRCLPPATKLLSGWHALAELLAALPAELGIVIPRQVDRSARRGACEHHHAPKTTKIDAADYLVDALASSGWAAAE